MPGAGAGLKSFIRASRMCVTSPNENDADSVTRRVEAAKKKWFAADFEVFNGTPLALKPA
jgi:hypothetical protein